METGFNPAAGAVGAPQAVTNAQTAEPTQINGVPVVYRVQRNLRGQMVRRPFANITDAEFERLQAIQNTRAPQMIAIPIRDVRRFSDPQGNPRVAFNQGSIVLSHRQLKSAGVIVPETLKGKTIHVDFFRVGDVLLNRSVITDEGRIVNQFELPGNDAVFNQLEVEAQRAAMDNWSTGSFTAIGANSRNQGQGTQDMTRNDQVSGAINQPELNIPSGQKPLASQAVDDGTGNQQPGGADAFRTTLGSIPSVSEKSGNPNANVVTGDNQPAAQGTGPIRAEQSDIAL
jgi:hypothetical protein